LILNGISIGPDGIRGRLPRALQRRGRLKYAARCRSVPARPVVSDRRPRISQSILRIRHAWPSLMRCIGCCKRKIPSTAASGTFDPRAIPATTTAVRRGRVLL
jgi:hypothetical protein